MKSSEECYDTVNKGFLYGHPKLIRNGKLNFFNLELPSELNSQETFCNLQSVPKFKKKIDILEKFMEKIDDLEKFMEEIR